MVMTGVDGGSSFATSEGCTRLGSFVPPDSFVGRCVCEDAGAVDDGGTPCAPAAAAAITLASSHHSGRSLRIAEILQNFLRVFWKS